METFNTGESFFDRTMRQMQEKGFDEYLGPESLATTKFIDGLFTPVLVQTQEQIIEKYSEGGKYIVELVEQPNSKIEEMLRRGLVTKEEASKLEIPETDRSFLVFRKSI